MNDAEVGLGLSVDFAARISASIDQQGAATRRALADLARRPPATPVFWRTGHRATVDANGQAFFRTFGGPQQGRIWYVRHIVVGGADPTIAAPGVADVYILGATPSTLFVPNLLDWQDRASSLPNVAYYGPGEMPLRAPEELVIRVSGGTATQMLAAAIGIEEFQDAASVQAYTR